MAYSPPDRMSPAMLPNRNEGVRSPSPAAPLQNKRDKRRHALAERLADLTTNFSRNRDVHYRHQLQALQVDMSLIMQADPYLNMPLDDMPEDIAEMVLESVGAGQNQTTSAQRPEPGLLALTGKWYAKFVEEINNAVEGRDASLTQLQAKHDRTIHDLYTTNRFKIRVAEEEYQILANTLNERLAQSIGQKKARLVREKEQIDLADNSALLHPSQFSITNPASPGGGASNRKTRHLRHHRAVDLDEFTSALDSNKRKRKHDDSGDLESPVPGAASPIHGDGQTPQSTYTIDKLFSEKELSVHLHSAAARAANYFAAVKAQEQNPNGIENADTDPDASDFNAAHDGQSEAADDESTPAPSQRLIGGADMERTTSHHATRGATRQQSSALNVLGDLALSTLPNGSLPPLTNPNTKVYLPPSALFAQLLNNSTHSTSTNKMPSVPPASGLRPDEIEADWLRMSRLLDGNIEEAILREVLPVKRGDLETGTSLNAPDVDGATASASAIGDISYGEVGSASLGLGLGDVGGVPMSRSADNSSMGGSVVMKRSASGAGFGTDGGKRIRSR